jgi:hypothetical protein
MLRGRGYKGRNYLFIVDPDPTICAQSLDSLRLNYATIFSGRYLSNAFRVLFPDKMRQTGEAMYYPMTRNHECSIWTSKNINNYIWMYNFFIEVNEEKFYRYGSKHTSFNQLSFLLNPNQEMTAEPDWDFGNYLKLKKDKGKDDDKTIFEISRNYLFKKWQEQKTPLEWGKRGKPQWAIDMEANR